MPQQKPARVSSVLRILSVFDNKGGIGKTTLTFHLGHALAELGERVLLVALDPQCNLTIYNCDTEDLHAIWEKEDDFFDDFDVSRSKRTSSEFDALLAEPRTVHFLLKPTEEGTEELSMLPPPLRVTTNLDLLPGSDRHFDSACLGCPALASRVEGPRSAW